MSFLKRWAKGWRLIFAGYLFLLGASHIWRISNPVNPALKQGQKELIVPTVLGDSLLTNETTRIAYYDVYTGSKPNPPVVLLLHGSPVAVSMFQDFIPALTDSFRVIAPYFPGYGPSAHNVPDYSIRAYGMYMKQFMEKLDIKEAHLVGYSLGGGVALNMAHFYPGKVQSIDMLSAIGVQELELVGSYPLNHAVHGIQLGLIWALYELTPHFGALDDFVINIPYARSFYDSDQRPLRNYLKNYKKPMLIQHGKEDRLVPLVAAQEHHRIVPQSKLKLYKGGHGMVRSRAKAMAVDLTAFITDVEANHAIRYTEADSTRLANSKMPFNNVDFTKFEGVSLMVIMILIALSTLVSEDLTCIGAGLMAARGLIGFWPAVTACFIGLGLGDMALYLAGRWLGRPAIRKAPFKWFIDTEDLAKSADWFHAKGPAIIIASRFLPGSRLPTYFSAGVIGAGFWMFSFYFLIAAIGWTPLLVGISMLLGTELITYFSLYKDYALWVFLGTVFLLVLIAKIVIPAFSHKGRRLIRSRWCRLVNWEFWSPYILYFPLCIYVVYLWARHRSLTIFSAANPGITDGGFIGESKSQILELFSPKQNIGTYTTVSGEYSTEEKIELITSFITKNNLQYPVFIKPDIGQRGAGVVKVKNKTELKTAVSKSNYDLIIQEYIEGEEYGVFYYRYPGEKEGHIYSVTTKELLTLKGDGKKTLEELILDNERTVCLAKMHLREHQNHLYEVPASGEAVELVSYGTHARGAVFGDGSHLITEDLVEEVNKICTSADGFFFGRLDIKTESEETFRKGRDLKIIEVNGVSSESTNIYDKQYSYWDAQKVLCNQWRIAFEIGAQNVKGGHEYSSIPSLVKKLLNFSSKK